MTTFNDFEYIAINKIPLIDTRAPVEFKRGSFPGAVNLPLMNDEERHLVGICYKEKGNEEAVKLGHQLVSGDVKTARVHAWLEFIHEHPNAMIFCFRGGQRSRISQQWIFDASDIDLPRLEGGYKAFRTYLMEQLNPENIKVKPIRLGGCTGSGKTILLNRLNNSIDLEGLANHRGSSFGKKIISQPTQINFETALAYAVIQHRSKGFSHLVIEDEGKNVGRCFLPKDLHEFFNDSDVVILNVSLEKRIQITMDEYVYQAQLEYKKEFGDETGVLIWVDYIRESMKRIRKRLGGVRFQEVIDLFEDCQKQQEVTGTAHSHEAWVTLLLKDYYDPMYQYQINSKKEKVVFEGDEDDVYMYLKYLG